MRDWQGTSRLCASNLISSKINSGSRNDMVFVDGFRFEKVIFSAFSQSIYSVELAFAQKLRSSSSLLNIGISFLFFIVMAPSFLFTSLIEIPRVKSLFIVNTINRLLVASVCPSEKQSFSLS